jgi:hypothetical protein
VFDVDVAVQPVVINKKIVQIKNEWRMTSS